MRERLFDVLNERSTVLHVVPVPVEGEATSDSRCAEQALKAASDLHLVPEPEVEKLQARIHVGRGGPLMPVGDVVQVRHEQERRLEERVRTRACFFWQQSGCPEGQADAHWHQACATESNSGA